MTINITNRIGHHKIPQRITQKQKTLTFLTTRVRGPSRPPRAAGVNDWFFLLAHPVVDVGIKQNAKCEMLLRKIDGEMNVQNCGFSAKLRNGNGGDMLHDWRQRQLSQTRAIIFRRDVTLPTSKSIAGDDQTTLRVHRNSTNIACTFRIYVCAIATVVPRLTVAAVAMHPHRRISVRWHVADVQDFTGYDQATLTVNRNSTI